MIPAGFTSAMPGSAPRREARPSSPRTQLLLIDAADAADVALHPDVAPLLQQGWQIRSATPRLVEAQGTRLLVVLRRPDRVPERSSPLTRIK